jgi:hypothetical protein
MNGNRAMAYAPGIPISSASATEARATTPLFARKRPKPWPPEAVEDNTSTYVCRVNSEGLTHKEAGFCNKDPIGFTDSKSM